MHAQFQDIRKILSNLKLDSAAAAPPPSTMINAQDTERRQATELLPGLNLESSPSQRNTSSKTASGITISLHERIPSEIWAEIFAIFGEGLPVHFPPDFSSPQWVLSRTCSRWRSIAFREYRLWNQIEVTSCPSANITAFASRMIFPPIPLSISVEDEGERPLFSAVVVETLVIPLLPRTKTLTLNLQSDGYTQLFQTPFESNSNRSASLKFWTLDSTIAWPTETSFRYLKLLQYSIELNLYEN